MDSVHPIEKVVIGSNVLGEVKLSSFGGDLLVAAVQKFSGGNVVVGKVREIFKKVLEYFKRGE